MLVTTTHEYEGRTFNRAYSNAGYLIRDAQGRHYADAVWPLGVEREFIETRIPIDSESGAEVPRRWTRLSIKTALAQAGMLAFFFNDTATTEIYTGYTAWEALTDCDYIEEGYPTTAQWGAILDGAADALGKTREEIDAFLATIPTEGGA